MTEQPYHPLDLDRLPGPNPWRDCVPIPAIGPNGDLAVRFVDKTNKGASAGQSPIETSSSGKGLVHPEFARLGWVLYEDLCDGRVPGVAASREHWTVWIRYVDMLAKGRVPAPGSIPEDRFYHPEVLRRRAKAAEGGLASMDANELAAYFGFSVDEASDLFDDET